MIFFSLSCFRIDTQISLLPCDRLHPRFSQKHLWHKILQRHDSRKIVTIAQIALSTKLLYEADMLI